MNMKRLVLDIVDAIALGIPSAAIAPQMNEKYGIEMVHLRKLISQLRQQYNAAQTEYNSAIDIQNAIINSLTGANPLGATYRKLMQLYDESATQAARANKSLSTLSNQLGDAEDKMSEAQRKYTRTFGETLTEDEPIREVSF